MLCDINFPLLDHSLFINSLLKSLKIEVLTHLLIHDLGKPVFCKWQDPLPFRMKLRMKLTEGDTFYSVTEPHAHNSIYGQFGG